MRLAPTTYLEERSLPIGDELAESPLVSKSRITQIVPVSRNTLRWSDLMSCPSWHTSLITPAFRYSFDALVLRLQFFSLSKLLESFLDEVLCAYVSDRRDVVIEPANLLLIR